MDYSPSRPPLTIFLVCFAVMLEASTSAVIMGIVQDQSIIVVSPEIIFQPKQEGQSPEELISPVCYQSSMVQAAY